MEINFIRGSYSLKIFFDNVNKTYIMVEAGRCYMLPEHLLQQFEAYVGAVYSGHLPALQSWYENLSPEEQTQIIIARTSLTQDEFFNEFMPPE